MDPPSTAPQRLDGPKRFAAYAVATLAFWTLWATVLRPLLPPMSPTTEVWVGTAARLAFWVAPALVYLRAARGRRWLDSIGLGVPREPSFAALVILLTLVVAAVLLASTAAQQGIAVETLIERLKERATLRWRAPLFEEVVFRGVVLSELLRFIDERRTGDLARRLSFWGAQFIQAWFFTAIHWPWWVSARGVDFALTASPSVFATGLVLGIVFGHTRTIWPGVVLHWLNNELGALT